MTPAAFRALREQQGLTQAELAWRLDVSPRTISNWERGQTRIPQAAVLALEALTIG